MLKFMCDYLRHNNNTPLIFTKSQTQDDYSDILFYDTKYC